MENNIDYKKIETEIEGMMCPRCGDTVKKLVVAPYLFSFDVKCTDFGIDVEEKYAQLVLEQTRKFVRIV